MKVWRSVRFKLALWYFVVLALGMVAFGVSSWFLLREVLLENNLEALDQRLTAMETFLSGEARGDDTTALQEEAREYSTSLPAGQGLRITNSAGVVLFERKAAAGPILSRQKSVVIRGHLLEIGLSDPQVDFYETLATLAWVMVAAFPIVLLVAISGGWWLAKRALLPVGEMTREARSISARDLSKRVSVPHTGDELQELAGAWNELLGRIELAVTSVKRFTADAAHELRTPVTVIRTTAELALRQQRSPENYRQALSSIEHETKQVTELLDQLLLLALGDAGEWKFQFETVFLDQVLRGLRTALVPLAENRQTRIEWTIPDVSVGLWADETAIRRLVVILVDNATKHTPPGGLISVHLQISQGGCLIMEITDSGAGIAPPDLPNIFDRFYRADPARTGGGGSGLGLTIAKTIVDAHRGTIEVASTGEFGTKFRVVLPPSEAAPISVEEDAVGRIAHEQ